MEAIELWLNFIKKAGKEDIKEIIKRKEELKIAMDMLRKISADERLREKYAAQEKARLDAVSSMKYAEAKGEAKGRAGGMAEGRADTIIKQFTKKLGILPASLQEKIRSASLSTMDLLAEGIFDIESTDEILELIEKN
ncbi:MAG: DUF4351 domain-containing protein [Firmicutes bacterium]|nr:DUF4351 domain-containing protein [Bacillota bacterium]